MYDLIIQGVTYQVKPLLLSEIAAGALVDGTPYSRTLYIPENEGDIGRNQIYNLEEEPLREALFALMEAHLLRDGRPLTIDDIVKLDWTVNDVGMFLHKLVFS